MGADENVHLPGGGSLEHFLLPWARHKTAEQPHIDGKARQTRAKGLIMLFGKHRGGAKQHHLPPLGSGAEGCTQGNFRLAEAHVAAHEPVHGLGFVHVVKHVLNGLGLIGRFLKAKGCLKFMVQLARGIITKALGHLAVGVHFHKVGGDLFNGLAGLLLARSPARAAQPVQSGFHTFRTLEPLDKPHAVGRHIELVAPGVFDEQKIVGNGVDVHVMQPGKTANAVIAVHQQIASLEIVKGIQPLEDARRNAGRFFRLGVKDILAQNQGVVPHQIRALTEGRNKSEKAALIGRVTLRGENAILFRQLQKLCAAAAR